MQWVWGPFAWNSTDATWELPSGCFSALDYRRLSDMGPETVGMRNFALFVADDAATFGVDHFVLGSGNPRNISMGLARRTRVKTDLALPTTPQASNLAELAAELFMMHSDPDGADMACPLVPTRRRRWEVHIAGHSLVIPFSQGHGAYDRLKTLLRRVYKRHYEDVQSGNLPPNHHRKWLGAQVRKYFGRLDDARYREFQGADVPDETPLMPTTIVSDNFNRSDESLDAGNWTEVVGGWSVVSNAAECVTDGGVNVARYNTSLSSDDHYAQCTHTNPAIVGPIIRRDSGATDTYYRVSTWKAINSTGIFKRVAGVDTDLGSSAVTYGNGQVVKLTMDGSAIESFINGVSKVSTTDTSITGNLHCGLFANTTTSGGAFDNFEAGDLEIVIGVGRISEVDTARVTSFSKAKQATKVTESDLSRTVNRIKSFSVGEASSTNIAFPMAKIFQLPQLSESNIASNVTFTKIKEVSESFEISTAMPLTLNKLRELGVGTETDISQSLSFEKTVSVQKVEETEISRPVDFEKVLNVGKAVESNITRKLFSYVAFISEINSSLPVGAFHIYSISATAETNLSTPLFSHKTISIGQVSEADISTPIENLKNRSVYQAIETSSASSVDWFKLKRLGIAGTLQYDSLLLESSSSDQLLLDSVSGDLLLLQEPYGSEINLARPIVVNKRYGVGRVTEINQTLATGRLLVGSCLENSYPLLVSPSKTLSHIQKATEFDFLRGITAVKSLIVGGTIEVNSANSILRTWPVYQVVENDSARHLAILVGMVTEDDFAFSVVAEVSVDFGIVQYIVRSRKPEYISSSRQSEYLQRSRKPEYQNG